MVSLFDLTLDSENLRQQSADSLKISQTDLITINVLQNSCVCPA